MIINALKANNNTRRYNSVWMQTYRYYKPTVEHVQCNLRLRVTWYASDVLKYEQYVLCQTEPTNLLQWKQFVTQDLLINGKCFCASPDLLEKFDFIQIKFIPRNTNLILQLMDQKIITNFRKLHIKSAIFQNDRKINLKIIWNGATKRTFNFAWTK